MRTSALRFASFPLPRHAPWRTPLQAGIIVLLLSALFAGAILAALQPHAPGDMLQAAIQGGL